MSNHHHCGPSSLYRRKACPGSMKMETCVLQSLGKRAPKGDSEDSEWAAEGTLLHEAVHNPEKREGLNPEQIMALETIDDFLRNFASVPTKHHELQLELTQTFLFDTRVMTFGTADFVAVLSDTEAVVADWKFGYVEVPSPEENVQLACYAAMVMQKFGVSKVTAYVIQPRISATPRSFTFSHFEGLFATISGILAACRSDDAALEAGGHCRYCTARALCPEYARLGSVMAYDTHALTLDNLADVWERSSVVLQRVNEIRDEIKHRLKQAGGQAPGIRLFTSGGNVTVADVQACYESVQGFFTIQEFLGFVRVSIGDFEKELALRMKEAGKVKSMKTAIDAFREMPFVVREGQRTSVVIDTKVV